MGCDEGWEPFPLRGTGGSNATAHYRPRLASGTSEIDACTGQPVRLPSLTGFRSGDSSDHAAARLRRSILRQGSPSRSPRFGISSRERRMVDLEQRQLEPSTDMAVPARRGVDVRCVFKCDIAGARNLSRRNLPPGLPLYSVRPGWRNDALRFRLLCTTLVAAPVITALAAPARQDVVQKTALITVVAEARGPVANLGPRDLLVREDRATRDVLDVRPATEPLFIALLINTIRPPAGVLAPTQDFRRGLAAFVSTIKGGNPDAHIRDLGLRRSDGHRDRLHERGTDPRPLHSAGAPQPAGRRRVDRGGGSWALGSSATSRARAAR